MADREFPVGIVTLLFTDIEGSTRLIEELGEEGYVRALAEHRRVLRCAFAAHDGVEVDTQGDAFLYAFADPEEALAAAAQGQEALTSGPVRVRMGLHTGELHLTGEGYAGRELHRAARIAASGHGGQVLVSVATRVLVDGELTDLGEHRLKDFDEPVALFQIGNQRFPPLKTISNTNLPRPASSFVGRQRERDELVSLLSDGTRLLTLSGPGGSGKTRLAIEAASELVPAFKAGVFWVGLAPLRDPALVPETIAQTLGAKAGVAEHVGDRELLLLLDNFEQVVEAAPELSRLLEACPNLSLMVTSRELLRIRGEVDYPVPPLAEPEAVELFCARAQLEPDETIAELCRRLDELPLALELAAARTSVLSPAQILKRLSERLDLLRGGRDAEARQRTLRATIEWSYDLLTDEEKRLFARLAVFVGGFTLEAAEQVAEADVHTVQSLVEKSLVRHTGERFWMLETILEYALERLEASGEIADIRRRHAQHFVTVAEEAGLHLDIRGEQARWLERLDPDLENLRAALVWSRVGGEPDLGLRLAVSLREFWFARGYYPEGLRWLAAAVEGSVGEHSARLKALRAAADLAAKGGDVASARAYAEEGLGLARAGEDHAAIADLMRVLASEARQRGDAKEHDALIAEGLTHAREAGDLPLAGRFLAGAGIAALEKGESEPARQLFRESLAVSETGESELGVGRALGLLGTVALQEGKTDEALTAFRASLATAARLGYREGVAYLFAGIACALSQRGQTERAARLLGAESRLAEDLHLRRERHHGEVRELTAAELCKLLGGDVLNQLTSEGEALSLDDAIDYALDPTD
jgi:predicted ATPase